MRLRFSAMTSLFNSEWRGATDEPLFPRICRPAKSGLRCLWERSIRGGGGQSSRILDPSSGFFTNSKKIHPMAGKVTLATNNHDCHACVCYIIPARKGDG